MKTISLTPTEFVNFTQLATFFFDLYVKGGFVFVTAKTDALDALGY